MLCWASSHPQHLVLRLDIQNGVGLGLKGLGTRHQLPGAHVIWRSIGYDLPHRPLCNSNAQIPRDSPLVASQGHLGIAASDYLCGQGVYLVWEKRRILALRCSRTRGIEYGAEAEVKEHLCRLWSGHKKT